VRTAHAASIDKRKLASRLRSRCDGDHKNTLLGVIRLAAAAAARAPQAATSRPPRSSSFAVSRRNVAAALAPAGLAGTVLIAVFPHFKPFLEVVSDPIVRFELALKTSNVFDMTVRPSCRDSPALCFGVPDLRRWSQRTSVLGHGRGFAASIRGRCFCGSNALCPFLFHPLFGR
jgi:hypothetical protein